MLIFEEGMMDLQIVVYNEESFKKFEKRFNEDGMKKIKKSYINIKALIVMFIENKKFEKENEFEISLKKHVENERFVNTFINDNQTINFHLKRTIYAIDKNFLKKEKIESYEEAKIVFKKLDKFNHLIPKMLEIRRSGNRIS